MPIRKTPDGRYHVEVCVNRRRLHRRCEPGASANDARLLEAKLIETLSSATPRKAPVVPGDPLLTELLADYAERHADTLRSPDTARYHAYRISKWVAGKRASEARQVRAAIVEDLTGHYAPATINRSLGALKAALRQAWERGATRSDYSGLVRRLQERNERSGYLTITQVQKIAQEASQPVRAAIWIALLTGCRRGEICKMRKLDIGQDKIAILAGNTKTLRHREVPIVPALRPWLEWIPLPIGAEGIKSGFRRAREAAGMPDVHFHDLRHSCASLLLSIGTPLDVVRDVLGHTSIRTTERYAHAIVDRQRMALDALGKMVGGAGIEPATSTV